MNESPQLELVLKSKPRRRPEPGFMSSEEAKVEYQRLERLRESQLNARIKESLNLPLTDRCSFMITSRVIDSTEAIDMLVANGMSEEAAFDWAMNRFSPSKWMRSGSEQIRNEISLPKSRSHKRKAA